MEVWAGWTNQEGPLFLHVPPQVLEKEEKNGHPPITMTPHGRRQPPPLHTLTGTRLPAPPPRHGTSPWEAASRLVVWISWEIPGWERIRMDRRNAETTASQLAGLRELLRPDSMKSLEVGVPLISVPLGSCCPHLTPNPAFREVAGSWLESSAAALPMMKGPGVESKSERRKSESFLTGLRIAGGGELPLSFGS